MNKLIAFIKKHELFFLFFNMCFWIWILIRGIQKNETYFLILPLLLMSLNVFNLLNYFKKKQNK